MADGVRGVGPVPQMRTGRSAILAPGGNYGPDGPLLMYARLAVHRRGGRIRPIVCQVTGPIVALASRTPAKSAKPRA